MHKISKLKQRMTVRGFKGVLSCVGTDLNQRYYERFHSPDGIYVVEEEWDNLFILDGCRYDLLSDCCELNGELERQRSLASESSGFIRENFHGRKLHDTVYVTANPFARSISSGVFHYMENLLDSSWDPDLLTVPPCAVREAVEKAVDRFPNKRIIAHFMQPHFPFIGEFGRGLDSGGINPGEKATVGGMQIWSRLRFGLGVTEAEVWRAYRENLEVVLDVVDDLLENVTGRTVLTSDHGNLVGDRESPIPVKGYGHPENLYVEPLVIVPWFVVDGDRREITAEDPRPADRLDASNVDSRLEALGYK